MYINVYTSQPLFVLNQSKSIVVVREGNSNLSNNNRQKIVNFRKKVIGQRKETHTSSIRGKLCSVSDEGEDNLKRERGRKRGEK